MNPPSPLAIVKKTQTALALSSAVQHPKFNAMSSKTRKPYTLVGAEDLTASVYKTGDELVGFDYRFNIVRLHRRTGRVDQWLTPSDLIALTKLVRVLAAELAVDGCMEPGLRDELFRLSASLDSAIAEASSHHGPDREGNQ